MSCIATCSAQNLTSQILVLRKPFVERDECQVCRLSECCKEGIAPDVGRKGLSSCLGSPKRLDVQRFVRETYSLIRHQQVERLPRGEHRQCIVFEDFSVCCKPQEPLLSHTAKVAWLLGKRIKPCPGNRVMRMTVERHRQPDVNVGEQHLLRPRGQRSSHWSERCCPADRNEPMEALFGSGPLQRYSTERHQSSRALLHPPATRSILPAQLPHFVLVLKCSSLNRTVSPPSAQ